MTRIPFSEKGNTPFEKLLGHNEAILESWNVLEVQLWQNTCLPKNLLEQVRRALAFTNECEYCMVKGGHPEFDKDDQKTSIAIAFAELFSKDHTSINEAHFAILKEYFTDKEISEFCAFIAFVQASQKFGNIMNLTEDYQENAIISLRNAK